MIAVVPMVTVTSEVTALADTIEGIATGVGTVENVDGGVAAKGTGAKGIVVAAAAAAAAATAATAAGVLVFVETMKTEMPEEKLSAFPVPRQKLRADHARGSCAKTRHQNGMS